MVIDFPIISFMESNTNCSVCIRECKIGNSFCHRRDENGHLKEGNRFNAILIDCLFDKPIINFRENTKVLSLGSWGCNFRCLGCQNVNLSWTETGNCLGFREMTAEDVIDMALKNGCKGICFTYNEPAILIETIENVSYKARENGLFNVFVTNCTLTEKSAKRISGCIDAVAADIKSLKDDFYYEYCGAKGIPDVANKILRCIKAFYDEGSHVEVRTNIIPGANAQKENYHAIASWIRDNMDINTPWHITRFFPANRLSHISQTPTESLLQARQAGFDEGLKNVHTFPDKGCDCAKEICMVESVKVNEAASSHCCCEK
jgi:pyruvate formate lyase activating enzyme